ncbi:hypothetical protein C0Q70_06482 [Pomacea canaliculata]|uniref:PH domain-containing protein n=1 Tax=Pomacea canaliculata TaxID=400727 RepID=A0A2T7PP55_POMCA|nr:hypothetical protein C0Q70_06482 [Pomacea canaliculata]
MRFNAKELAVVMQQVTSVDKEGILYMKERQDSIFKKSEVYVDRFCKLKGNLLFYFKNKETKTEPLGVLVLERCTVELDLEEEAANSFILVCEGEDNPFKFAATTEEERDRWIQALHMASYECLKMQLQSLREQLQARTGRDPVTLPDRLHAGLNLDFQTGDYSPSELWTVIFEVSACDFSLSDLPSDSHANPPSCLVVVHVIVPFQQQLWVYHNHTDIAERSSNPMFLKTIGFGDNSGVDTSQRVRLSVYSVKERMTGTMAQLGQAIFTLQDVLMAPDMTLKPQPPKCSDSMHLCLLQLSEEGKNLLSPRGRGTIFLGEVRSCLQLHFCNIIKRSFRFATNNESTSLQVHEYMAEFKHASSIPAQLLQIWINEEKHLKSLLDDLGELSTEAGKTQQKMIQMTESTISLYSHHYEQLAQGVGFKRSIDKDRPELEFVPVNLHLETMAVSKDSSKSGSVYDALTMGAPTAFIRKYKSGGLRRMLQHRSVSHTPDSTVQAQTVPQHACCLYNTVTQLRSTIIALSSELSNSDSTSSSDKLASLVDELAAKARRLVRLCEDPVLCAGAEDYQQERQLSMDLDHSTPSTSTRQNSTNVADDVDLFLEPWVVTRLNLEAAIVNLISTVESLSSGGQDLEPDLWHSHLCKAVLKLQSSVEAVLCKISIFLMFLIIKITALVAGVCSVYQVPITPDRQFPPAAESLWPASGSPSDLHQLLYFICHLLAFPNAHFTVVCSDVRQGIHPDFSRHVLCVQIPLDKLTFSCFPEELQKGKNIKVCPVFFNIGINEEATYAEKFGNTSLQDRINSESFTALSSYYGAVKKLQQDSEEMESGPLNHLMKLLHANVSTKKSKNVEILHLTEEICRSLRGVRITTCKSGKDRTSMAVTLEFTQLLQKHHDLASHVFWQALDCFRSVGCRRENTSKNTGVKKYAFNRFQMLYIPKLYRAPGGTYGNILT